MHNGNRDSRRKFYDRSELLQDVREYHQTFSTKCTCTHGMKPFENIDGKGENADNYSIKAKLQSLSHTGIMTCKWFEFWTKLVHSLVKG